MEKLSTSKDAAGIKLLILYILKKINKPIGSMDLTDYVVGERLTDFVSFQQRINELISSNHIALAPEEGVNHYAITDEGLDLLSKMIDLIPRTEKNRVDRTARKFARSVLNNRSVIAEYVPEDERGGVVRLLLKEGDLSILNMEIAIASKKEARAICRNWKTNTAGLYAGIVELLLESPEDSGDIWQNTDDIPRPADDISRNGL